MNYLSVENLTKSFADRLLFADLTFGIDQGQKVAIVAKNGSGKTTILRCLAARNDASISFSSVLMLVVSSPIYRQETSLVIQ